MDEKGMRVSFVDGQVLMQPKGKSIDDAVVIGEQEGVLYKLKGQPEQDLAQKDCNVHYRALPHARKSIEGLLEIQTKHDGVYKGCAKGKNTKNTFPSSKRRKKESWKSSTPMYAVRCHPVH